MDIGCIKIDAEFNEKDIILGARKTIMNNNRPPIFFETHHDQDAMKNEIIDLLTSNGYTTFKEEGEKDKTNWYMILATADEDTESEEEEEDLLDHDGLKSIE